MGADKKCILEKNMSKIINAETAIDEIKKTIIKGIVVLSSATTRVWDE